MGADNWRVCPKCKAGKAVAQRAKLREAALAAKEGYGKVSPEEYQALCRKLSEAEAEPETGEETFREDFYIGTDENGLFTVVYHGECESEECKFTVKFKHSDQKRI